MVGVVVSLVVVAATVAIVVVVRGRRIKFSTVTKLKKAPSSKTRMLATVGVLAGRVENPLFQLPSALPAGANDGIELGDRTAWEPSASRSQRVVRSRTCVRCVTNVTSRVLSLRVVS